MLKTPFIITVPRLLCWYLLTFVLWIPYRRRPDAETRRNFIWPVRCLVVLCTFVDFCIYLYIYICIYVGLYNIL